MKALSGGMPLEVTSFWKPSISNDIASLNLA
jgi:hypothetical protein